MRRRLLGAQLKLQACLAFVTLSIVAVAVQGAPLAQMLMGLPPPPGPPPLPPPVFQSASASGQPGNPASKDGQILFDPQQGFMMVTPPPPHYNHDPLHGVNLMAIASRVEDEMRSPPPPPLLPLSVDQALATQMQQVHEATPLEPNSVPKDAVSRQIFGNESPNELSSISQPRCQTICDYEKTIIKPKAMTVAVPQEPKYEQYVIPPPPGCHGPPTYGVRPVPQEPVYSNCVQYEKETLPMRAQFASEPVDPNFLNSLDPTQAEAVVEDHEHQQAAATGCHQPPATYSAYPPVKTSALED